MITDKITLQNIQHIRNLSIEFIFSESNIIVVTGKNGAGKTSLVKAFKLISDLNIFKISAGLNAIRDSSKIEFEINGLTPFSFAFNKKLDALDTKNALPNNNEIIAELSFPYGNRFDQFSLIAQHDADIRNNIASSNYKSADELIKFLSQVYASNRFTRLKSTKVKKHEFYFILQEEDYYIREDHFSSGEFFLIQIFRLITSGATLVLIDELDIALDTTAQVKLYGAIKKLLRKYNTRLITISHSLAFMNTVEDDNLYYLEEKSDVTTLEQRSFGYIKSDLYGFRGYDRYIITEDAVLEGFIEYVIKLFPIKPYYQHITIGVGGVNQLRMITEKNDSAKIFSESENVMCVIDGDASSKFNTYTGTTKIICSPVQDIEKYIYCYRKNLKIDSKPLPLGEYKEDYKIQQTPKQIKNASKGYWKWLCKQNIDNGLKITENMLYQLIVEDKKQETKEFFDNVQKFLNIRK